MAGETVYEREKLYASAAPKLTAFSPRPLEKYALSKPPTSNLKIECSNWYRTKMAEANSCKPTMNYRLWSEAGKFYRSDKPESNVSLQDVDWAVWRNYAHLYGYCDENDPAEQIMGGKRNTTVNDAAQLFPIAIPKPSLLNKNTMAKFLEDNPSYIKNDKQRRLIISCTDQDVEEFRRLRLRSETRNPPIDRRGKILPPPNFRKYKPINLVGAPKDEPEDVYESAMTIDMFGQPIKQIHTHSRMFLSANLNCPTYAKVFEKIKDAMDATQHRSVKLATLLSETSGSRSPTKF